MNRLLHFKTTDNVVPQNRDFTEDIKTHKDFNKNVDTSGMFINTSKVCNLLLDLRTCTHL